jgi:predicted nucleotidyltransferase
MLDTYLGTRTSWKILFVISEAPGKAISHKDIRELTCLGNKVITKFLIILKKSDIIIAEKIGKTTYYKMNMNNNYSRQILELIKLEKSSINNLDFKITNILRDFIYNLTNTNIELINSMYLFGSYSKRTYNKDSDIDVAIIINERNTALELEITAIVDNIEKRYRKEIQPHYYTIKEFLNNKNKLILEIKKDGIKLI